MPKNYYDILGISKTANADEIKRAYRKLASEHHPDRGGHSDKFKEINEAYQVLSDSGKRSQYDQYGQTFEQAQRQGGFSGNPFGGYGFEGSFNGASGSFGFEDILSSMFGGEDAQARNRGIDLEMPLRISFKEAVFGVEKEVTIEKKNPCPKCSGSGAEPGSKINTCPKCHGQGQIKIQRRTIFGTVATSSACDRCEGTGKVPEKPCTECKGIGLKRGRKTIKVSIPAGIDDGQRIRVRGEGEQGYRGSAVGDLYIQIEVLESKEFVRKGFDLYKEQSISFPEAALGMTLETATIDGTVKIKIPAGTQSGKVFRISDTGVPHLNRSGRGDMYVTILVHTPEKLTKKQKELLKQFEEEK